MKKLIEGVQRFMTTAYASERELFERLAGGQSPEVLFITCSDSRIDPGLITQTKPGELFVVRNAGNLIPPHGAGQGGEGPTIEYAVAALGVKHVIVCGHSGCGAMKAVLDPPSAQDLPLVSRWLELAEPTRRIMRESFGGVEGDARLMTAIEINVLAQLANLRTHPVVASGLTAGKLDLHGWVYHIGSGQVLAFDAEQGRFTSLSQGPERAAPSVELGRLVGHVD